MWSYAIPSRVLRPPGQLNHTARTALQTNVSKIDTGDERILFSTHCAMACRWLLWCFIRSACGPRVSCCLPRITPHILCESVCILPCEYLRRWQSVVELLDKSTCPMDADAMESCELVGNECGPASLVQTWRSHNLDKYSRLHAH